MDKFYQFIIEQREKHMEERDKRDVPEVGACSFLGRQAVGGFPAHTESKEDRGTGSESIPRLQLPMPDLQLLRLDQAPALLAFERENRAYFAASVPDRGDEFFAEFDTRYAQLLAGQGLATAVVCKVRELAATEYGLSRLRARVTQDNPASRKVLEHNGFVAVGELTLNGKLAMSYICELR
jgi:GNAT acetyltransferase-like protein